MDAPTDTPRSESAPETVAIDGPADPSASDGEAYVCDYCGRPFAREEWLALHRGLDHEDRITPAEREAFEAAYEDEEADLRMFRLQALGALVLIYFFFLIVYGLTT